MKNQTESRSLFVAAGIAIAATSLPLSAVIAQDNPFQVNELSSGYMVASHEGSCGEGKCGMKMMDTDNDGVVSKEEFVKHAESRFEKHDKNQDGKLSEDEMKMMQMMHMNKMKGEGKCGESKCGANKSDS